MTANWATTWASITSVAVTPATQLLSSRPSFLSMMKDKAVSPTAMKYVMERMTPGAMNSVKVGSLDPYTGSSKAMGNLAS